MTAQDVIAELQQFASVEDAMFLQRFFKTGAGQYGAGDVFIGVRVPQTRAVCRQFRQLALPEIQKLLDSTVHEHRLAGLIIMTLQYPKVTADVQQALFDSYLTNVYRGRINNWDLVDLSADRIMGQHLLTRPTDILFELAHNEDLWQRRVAIMSSFAFIKNGEPGLTLELAEVLVHDQHDLIQKAVGWMLREVGKRCDQALLFQFLDRFAATMPRTMLRYSLEKVDPSRKTHYMQVAYNKDI